MRYRTGDEPCVAMVRSRLTVDAHRGRPLRSSSTWPRSRVVCTSGLNVCYPRERCVLWVYKSLGRVDGAFSRSFSFFFFFFFLKYFFFSTEISSTKPRARSIVSRGLQGCHERVSRVMHTISRELLDWRYLSEFPVRC